MPSYVSHGWRIKKPFSELLPEVDSQGEQREMNGGGKRKIKPCAEVQHVIVAPREGVE